MNLIKLGFSKKLERYCSDNSISLQKVGRVIAEHKGRYDVRTEEGEISSEVTGKILYEADDRSSFPCVGDWVVVKGFDDKYKIESILPRSSALQRKAAGSQSINQIIASNIDYGLIVQALNRDFNVKRLERYVTICNDSEIRPIVLLSKYDLMDQVELEQSISLVKRRLGEIQVIYTSSETTSGFDELKNALQRGKTYCLLGSSGAGKSTIVNNLIGFERMKTGDIGSRTNKGRHTTTNRQLIVLSSGGIIIDNPGLREVGIGNASVGLETTFNDISEISRMCKFNDCKHVTEKGCAVLKAIDYGSVDHSSYNNYMRMQREIEHYQSSEAERRQKGKDLAKLVKDVKKSKKHRY